jgi:hypothetical protein
MTNRDEFNNKVIALANDSPPNPDEGTTIVQKWRIGLLRPSEKETLVSFW